MIELEYNMTMPKTFTEPLADIEEPIRMLVLESHDLSQYGLDADLWAMVGVQGDDLVGFTAYLEKDSEKPYQTVVGQPVRIILSPELTFKVL